MLDYDRIAQKLTKRLIHLGELPIEDKHLYTEYIYAAYGHKFILTSVYAADDPKEPIQKYNIFHPKITVSVHEAITRVWSELSEDEKTDVMSNTLGQHD